MSEAGRPPTYTDQTVVQLRGGQAKAGVQSQSARRAILDVVIDHKGRTTLGAIDAAFGYSMRKHVMALARAHWLEIEE